MADTLPAVGTPAPDFTLEDQTGSPVTLSDFRGKQAVVLYFYPKADTSGCTVEASGFRDAYADYQALNVAILGVSPDPVKALAKFTHKYNLPFRLLADVEHHCSEAYGVWGEKTFMGRKYMGVHRVTFLIDREGVIRKVFPKVKPEGHSVEVLEALKEIV